MRRFGIGSAIIWVLVRSFSIAALVLLVSIPALCTDTSIASCKRNTNMEST